MDKFTRNLFRNYIEELKVKSPMGGIVRFAVSPSLLTESMEIFNSVAGCSAREVEIQNTEGIFLELTIEAPEAYTEILEFFESGHEQ